MKTLILALVCIGALACSSRPAFNPAADIESAEDRPCYNKGEVVPGWHRCAVERDSCCPIGAACSKDEFVVSPGPGFCRWYGSSSY
jgi:hypothetical protein